MTPTQKQLEDWADETSGLAAAWWATAEDLIAAGDPQGASSYEGDAQDAERIEKLLRDGKFAEALQAVRCLDTSPRDAYEWARSAEVLAYTRSMERNPSASETKLRVMADNLWPATYIDYQWESEDKDLVDEIVRSARPRGKKPADAALRKMKRIVKSWDNEEIDSNDMIEEVGQVMLDFWKAHPEAIGRRPPTGAELRGWYPWAVDKAHPVMVAANLGDHDTAEKLARDYYALGTTGNTGDTTEQFKRPDGSWVWQPAGNPKRGGWLRGLASAGLAALGVGGLVMGHRESKGD